MTDKNFERNIKNQFDQSTYMDDYSELWSELEPRLPRKKKRIFLFWVYLSSFLLLSLFLLSNLEESTNTSISANSLEFNINKLKTTTVDISDDSSSNIKTTHNSSSLSSKESKPNKLKSIIVEVNKSKLRLKQEDEKSVLESNNKNSNNNETNLEYSYLDLKQSIKIGDADSKVKVLLEADSKGMDVSRKSFVHLSRIQSIVGAKLLIDRSAFRLQLPQRFVDSNAGKSISLIVSSHLGVPFASYNILQSSNEYEKIINDNLKFRKALQFGIEAPFKINDNFSLGLRASYLNIEEELDVAGQFQIIREGNNPNAFLISGVTSLGAIQEYSTTYDINIHQRNQFEIIKLSPTFSFTTKGKLNFGAVVIPEFIVYQNYSGILFDSEYNLKGEGDIFESRNFNTFNWTTELFLRKHFSESSYLQLSIQYSKLELDNNLNNFNRLNSIHLISLGASFQFKF